MTFIAKALKKIKIINETGEQSCNKKTRIWHEVRDNIAMRHDYKDHSGYNKCYEITFSFRHSKTAKLS